MLYAQPFMSSPLKRHPLSSLELRPHKFPLWAIAMKNSLTLPQSAVEPTFQQCRYFCWISAMLYSAGYIHTYMKHYTLHWNRKCFCPCVTMSLISQCCAKGSSNQTVGRNKYKYNNNNNTVLCHQLLCKHTFLLWSGLHGEPGHLLERDSKCAIFIIFITLYHSIKCVDTHSTFYLWRFSNPETV